MYLTNTAQHTNAFKPVEIKSAVASSDSKMFHLRATPISTQDPLKPLLNTKQLFQMPTTQSKMSMAVNQQVYTEVPEQQLLNYYASLRSDPLNQNLNSANSVKFVKNEIITDNILPCVFEEKNYMNVRHVDQLAAQFSPADQALKQLISTRFLKSTCTVLETQFHHLIEHRENPIIVKEVVGNMEDVLNRERINVIEYTVYEQKEIEKCHYLVNIFKSYFH